MEVLRGAGARVGFRNLEKKGIAAGTAGSRCGTAGNFVAKIVKKSVVS
jgi:hypothetical protein